VEGWVEELMEETPAVVVGVRVVRVGVCVTSSTPLLSPVFAVMGFMSPLYCVWS